MGRYIESNYYYLAKVYQDRNNILKNRVSIWGNKVLDIEENMYILKTNNELRTEIENKIHEVYKSEKMSFLLDYMDLHKSMINRLNIDFIYQIGVDYSDRRFVDYDLILFENKKILTVTIKYYYNNKPLLTIGYSSSFDQFAIEDIIDLIDSNLSRVYDYSKAPILNTPLSTDYIVFSPFTAAIVNHEVFGHFFEYDNYYAGLKHRKTPSFPEFISVFDSPEEQLGGYCKFDDVGNVLKNEIIIDNGVLNNLITDNKNVGIKRCRAGSELLLPRVTNTILLPSNRIYFDYSLKKALFIEGISQAIFKNDVIIAIIDSGYVYSRGNICKLPPFKIKLDIIDFIQGIVACFGENARYSTIDCIKKKQRCGGVGVSSSGMIIQLESSYHLM
ncbi:hypothetical protein KQI41_12515 [Tissierella pigra]|uniref:metallopeptidase TldD-related protein n=1 Tax=Tissierella pigra TaxID=2607614 RepID=UPI001C11EB52|nr:metallopeptidase TldD-related protein [Tissierella pigra]MBU5427239.1 hypothetical protein [Tissierella pigra]